MSESIESWTERDDYSNACTESNDIKSEVIAKCCDSDPIVRPSHTRAEYTLAVVTIYLKLGNF